MRWKRNVFLILGLVMGIFWGIRQSEVTAFAAEQTGFRQKTGRQAGLWTIPMPTAETVDFGQRAEPQQDDEIADIDVTEIQEYLDQFTIAMIPAASPTDATITPTAMLAAPVFLMVL